MNNKVTGSQMLVGILTLIVISAVLFLFAGIGFAIAYQAFKAVTSLF